ncbi:transcriptional regulator with XRE-family HTH domain [Kitasatospora sp. MAA19]|uniref:helix-turn-helix transcriptional regulator n=1 Tax=Kitasatospora sp. MAA19 TaxID=3035090 RepID=UPI002473D0A3|nr:helix-turn-helix transcriptional regulator [Kitasatospora sp. MAA19]MDH6710497.1 transcriptional regulator with XRE-family HTH domain [Kitasatospora sp. MAA19]
MSAPEPLPAHLLADPTFVAACANRQIGAVFQAAKRAGISVTQIARRTGLSTSRVTEITSGGRVVSSMDVIERIADGLHIPGRMLGLADRPWEAAAIPTGYQPAAVPETWEVLDMLSRSTASSAALSHLEAAVAGVAYRYPSTPPVESVPTLHRQLTGVHEMLARPQSLAARRRGVRILAVVSGLLGLANHDLGDRSKSDAHFHLGTVAAGEGEADDLTAWLLTMQSIVEYTAGRRAPAAALLQQAAALAETASPRRRAWVAANLARGLAARGDREAALVALDQASHLLDTADEPIGGLDFLTAGRLDGLAGETYAHLGEHDAAADLLETAMVRRAEADVKGRSVLTIDLAECRLGQGDLDAACALAHSAFDLAGVSIVQPLVLRARQLQQTLTPWSGTRPVRELTARVRELGYQLARA